MLADNCLRGVLRSLQPDSLNIVGKCSNSIKEKQKQPLLGCLQLLLSLWHINFLLPYLKKKKKKVKNFFSAELECGGWDLGLSNFQNPVNSVLKLNLLSPIEDR